MAAGVSSVNEWLVMASTGSHGELLKVEMWTGLHRQPGFAAFRRVTAL